MILRYSRGGLALASAIMALSACAAAPSHPLDPAATAGAPLDPIMLGEQIPLVDRELPRPSFVDDERGSPEDSAL